VRLVDDGLGLVDEAGKAGYLGVGQVLGDLGRGDVGAQVTGVRRAGETTMAGERRSSQASATWAGVAPRRSAGPASSS
jgi:hypothetical protein